MHRPEFPYLGNQVLISSGRVTVHSYDDFIFLFGKKGVAISTPATLTVDASERTILASPKIELGYRAEEVGEPLLLGNSTVTQIGYLLDAIKNMSDALNKLSAEEPETAIAAIKQTTTVLSETATTVKKVLNSTTCLSSNTYTK